MISSFYANFLLKFCISFFLLVDVFSASSSSYRVYSNLCSIIVTYLSLSKRCFFRLSIYLFDYYFYAFYCLSAGEWMAEDEVGGLDT